MMPLLLVHLVFCVIGWSSLSYVQQGWPETELIQPEFPCSKVHTVHFGFKIKSSPKQLQCSYHVTQGITGFLPAGLFACGSPLI